MDFYVVFALRSPTQPMWAEIDRAYVVVSKLSKCSPCGPKYGLNLYTYISKITKKKSLKKKIHIFLLGKVGLNLNKYI